jgi:probable F420-dependent oxidoreductase
MNLANLAYDLQVLSEGRFLLGLGSQVRPHIERRFSSAWGKPVARMREIVVAIRAIFDAWEGRSKLEHRGEYYTHTLMIPAFDPGPNPFGPPPIYTAGYGPKMVQVAGEVADGFLAHPFNTRESHLRHTLPALERGLELSGRSRDQLDVIAVAMVVTGDTEEAFEAVKASARGQLSFYGSTPAYRPVLDCHGWGDLHPRLNAMSKEGRWDEMAALIDDEMLETICVVGERSEIAGRLHARMQGIADGVSLTNTRCPDAGHWRAEVADFKRLVA